MQALQPLSNRLRHREQKPKRKVFDFALLFFVTLGRIRPHSFLDMKDLDDLLNLSAPTTSSTAASSSSLSKAPAAVPKPSASAKPAGKDTGNLEDWLDSVI